MISKIRKQKIGDKEYSFQMTNKSIFKIDEKYGNYAKVHSGLMEGEQFYANALRLISCCCLDKNKYIKKEKEVDEDFTIDELLEKLTPSQLHYEIPDLATRLYFDYIGINDDETEETEEKQEDNQEKN